MEDGNRMDKILSLTVFWFPVVVTGLYLATALAHLAKKNYGWSIAWGAYALANIGLLVAMYRNEGVGS